MVKLIFFQILWKIRCNILVSFPSHLKKLVLYWDFDLKSWIVDFFTRFTWEKTPQNKFSSQNFSVENNYCFLVWQSLLVSLGQGDFNLWHLVRCWKYSLSIFRSLFSSSFCRTNLSFPGSFNCEMIRKFLQIEAKLKHD